MALRSKRLLAHAANLVSASRLILTPVFLYCVVRQRGLAAAFLFTVIASSDYIDGRIARSLGAASTAGRFLDHIADICFILSALLCYWWLGLVPLWVPAAIAVSFTVYVVDSLRRAPPVGIPQLVGSRIGHAGGVMNYILIGVLVGNETLGLGWLPAWLVAGLFWLVPLYSGAAVLTRLPRPRARLRTNRSLQE